MEAIYTNYYLNQAGGGINDIGSLYANTRIVQHGRGSIGAFFSGIYKSLKPIISSGLNALKKQTIKSGTAVLENIGTKPFKDILQEQGKIAAQELTQKGINKLKRLQEGSGKGIKRKLNGSESQSTFAAKRKRFTSSIKNKLRSIAQKNKTSNTKDIFSN